MTEQVIGNTPQISDYLLTDDYNVNSSQIGASSACVKTAVNDMNASLDSMANVIGANIGSIITLICSNTYVPLGTLPLDGSEYSADLFQNFYTNFLISGRLLTCTYAEFSTQLASTGNCAKFAVDTVNRKFRVPLLKDGDTISNASNLSEIGKSIKAGLPNIKGNTGGTYNAQTAPAGAFYPGATLGGAFSGGTTNFQLSGFDASRYNALYNDSNTSVTVEGVRLRHFVVLASAQNNASVFDWSNYMAGLAGKANLDMDNLTQVGTTAIAHYSSPSNRIVAIAVPASLGSFEALGDGDVTFVGNATAVGGIVSLAGAGVRSQSTLAQAVNNSVYCTIRVSKGTQVQVYYVNVNNLVLTFNYNNGAF